MGRAKKPAERQFNAQVGERICKLRRECGLRAAELARSIGISRGRIYSYEIGESSCSSLSLEVDCSAA